MKKILLLILILALVSGGAYMFQKETSQDTINTTISIQKSISGGFTPSGVIQPPDPVYQSPLR